MYNCKERSFFLENGYLHVKSALDRSFLKKIRLAFDMVWEVEKPAKVNQHKLLKYPEFIDLIEHEPILKRHKAIFGGQVQLLQYDLLRQGPRQEVGGLSWHRDFSFPGDRPLSINTIVYLDDMGRDRGPTRVIPKSHFGEKLPPLKIRNEGMSNEVLLEAEAGDAVFINSAIWHTGDRNQSDGLRRGVYLYYGYWWLKRYESSEKLPWQVFEGASEQRLRLLGIKMPDNDLHIYDPDK